MLALLIIQLVALVASIVAITLCGFELGKRKRIIIDLEASLAAQELEIATIIEVGRDAFPYLAQTSVDMFYGETNGVQYSFQQRQEIAAKVQKQNTILGQFKTVFRITPTDELKVIEGAPKDGREALDMMNSFVSGPRQGWGGDTSRTRTTMATTERASCIMCGGLTSFGKESLLPVKCARCTQKEPWQRNLLPATGTPKVRRRWWRRRGA